MNKDSPSNYSINENSLPLLTQLKDPAKAKSDHFSHSYLRTEIRSFLSSSILQRHADSEFMKLNWVYNKMLQMRFYRQNILDLFRKMENFDSSPFIKESLLNYFIDIYYKEFTLGSLSNRLFSDNNYHISNEEDSFLKKLEPKTSKSLPLENMDLSIEIDKQCPICLLDFDSQIIIKSLPNCNHVFCEDCLINYLKFEITTGKVSSIKCPLEVCLLPITESYITNILEPRSQSILIKYRKFKVDFEVLSDPNKKWCIRANCNTWLLKNPLSNHLICPKCNQEFCFLCNNAWHENKSCEEAIDEDYLKYEAEVMVKHCPKCDWKIEKNEGCNHMHCRCGHHFCWLCLGDYENGYCVNKCPKFPANFLHNNMADQLIFMENLEWELQIMRLEESKWTWFDDMGSLLGKFKYFIAFLISFMSFPIILIVIFYGTTIFGIFCEPMRKVIRIIRGIDEYPIDVEFRCDSFENGCYLLAFMPFFLFMNVVLLAIYFGLEFLFYIEKHIYTNFLKYFIILDRTNNVYAIFRHLKLMMMRNTPRMIVENENENAEMREMRVVKMLAAISFFFILAIHFLLIMIVLKHTI